MPLSDSNAPEEIPRKYHTVLDSIAELVGMPSKVLLPDTDSEHGVSPMVDPARAANVVPQGRANYQIMGEIARGGMGTILKGHDSDLGRDVAVKVLDDEMSKNPAVVQRFVEEAQIGGQLQHPGIVPVYELGLMADDRPYFTMKLIKGRTLLALLQQRKDPSKDRSRFLSIFEDICQTMAYAHSKGVIHRDLKPANIMVGAFGEVQVVDWGLAKVLNRGGVADERRAKESLKTIIETVRSGPGSSGSDSMIGSVMGTPAYMAPEQAQGEIEKLDERADVFGLGAILCEILTGAPPYVDGEDRTVVQAARAQLDPCRERVQQCDADDELKRLCLDCLMTSREARPANAEEVAQTIHEYLATVEERAHRAELSAAEARLEAAEQRRARTRTTAIAGAVLLAIVLGGGGFYFVEQERAARLELARTARAERAEQLRASIDTLHDEAFEMRQVGRYVEAVAVAERAQELASQDEATEDLRQRTERILEQAQVDLVAEEHEQELLGQDLALKQRLEELQYGMASFLNNQGRAEYDEHFAEAFREYGVDLEGDDLVPAMERIRERRIAEEVALALDDWSRIRGILYHFTDDSVVRLVHLAIDLDPDPVRKELREALLAADVDAIVEFLRPDNLHRLPPGSIRNLTTHVWRRFPQHKDKLYPAYDHALQLYPDSFVLQVLGRNLYQDAGRWQDALSCRAAMANLRPDDATLRVELASALGLAGRPTQSLAAYRVALEVDPNHALGLYELGLTLQQLGDYSGAVEAYERSLAVAENAEVPTDILVARFYAGEASLQDVLEALEQPGSEATRATYAWALVDHPDPEQHRPEVALELIEPLVRFTPSTAFFLQVEAAAHLALGQPEAALRALDRWLPERTNSQILTLGGDSFMRAIAHAQLGRSEVAREHYAFGVAAWEQISGGDPTTWAQSDLVRWRDRARETLGI